MPPPPVVIGLTELQNSGWAKAHSAHPLAAALHEGKIDYFYKLPTGFLSASSSLKHLFPCFEHFYARNIAKIRIRFGI